MSEDRRALDTVSSVDREARPGWSDKGPSGAPLTPSQASGNWDKLVLSRLEAAPCVYMKSAAPWNAGPRRTKQANNATFKTPLPLGIYVVKL